MSFVSWLRSRTSIRSSQRRPQPCFRPQLEALEDRCLPSTLIVRNVHDHGPGSLRAEIAAAKTGDVILFDPKLASKAITLTSGELDITTSLTIQGLGAGELTISGDRLSRVFEVAANTTVTLNGLNITDGNGVADPLGSKQLDGLGGGILNEGTLSVNGCTVSGCSGDGQGGGIGNTGILTVSGSTISGCSAPCSVGGGIFNFGILTVSGCTLASNSARSGGGIWSEGTLTVSNSSFSNNHPDNIVGPYTDGGGNTFG
jgi:hypothetical protein